MICGAIDHGIAIRDYILQNANGSDKLVKIVGELVLLTQVIKSHNTRVPGSDKMARALFRAIADKQTTFRECFNRRNGLFLPAWKKKEGAICGGQQAMRAFLDLARKKSDDLSIDVASIRKAVPLLAQTVNGNLSDDSDD